jgi:hypothetical protein
MVARWDAKWNWLGFGHGRCGRRIEEPRERKAGGAAEIDGGWVQGQAADGGPKIQRVAVGAAGEAVVDLAGEMDREGSA